MDGGIPGHLGQRRVVGRDDGRAASHRFEDGHAEALVQRREDEHLRRAVERRLVLLADLAGEDNVRLQAQLTHQHARIRVERMADEAQAAGQHELIRLVE